MSDWLWVVAWILAALGTFALLMVFTDGPADDVDGAMLPLSLAIWPIVLLCMAGALLSRFIKRAIR